MSLYTIYFSATDTTRRCVEAVCKGLDMTPAASINLADGFHASLPSPGKDDVVVVAVPVYGGRVPVPVAETLNQLRGSGAMAIAMVVYGNRDFDDALMELTDILVARGFRVIGCGAFIGQHSIFPKVATARPDKADDEKLRAFGAECKAVVLEGEVAPETPFIKGRRPYKKPMGVPFHPCAKVSDCRRCGVCVTVCPVGAIDAEKPFETDAAKCLSCGRCITVCKQGARAYSGMAYKMMEVAFKTMFSKRKEPVWKIAK